MALHGTCALLALSSIWIAPPAAAAEDGCAVSVVLVPASREANVTLERDAFVVFVGKTSVIKPENWTGYVRILASVERGWTYAVYPWNISFPGGTRANATFNVSVGVPAGTQAHDGAQLVVTAQGVFNGTLCGQAQAQAIVGAREYYGGMSAEVTPASVSLGSGSAPALVFLRAQQVTNYRREPIVSGVSFEAPEGLRVSCPPTATLAAMTNTTIGAEFTVQVEWAGAAAGRYLVSITVRSGAGRTSADAPWGNATAVLEVIVPEPLATYQLWASAAIGAAAAAATAVWLWKSRTESSRRP